MTKALQFSPRSGNVSNKDGKLGRNDVAKAVKRSENVTKVLQFSRMLGGRQRNVKYHRRRAIEN